MDAHRCLGRRGRGGGKGEDEKEDDNWNEEEEQEENEKYHTCLCTNITNEVIFFYHFMLPLFVLCFNIFSKLLKLLVRSTLEHYVLQLQHINCKSS